MHIFEFFLLGDSLASEVYVPTFRNNLFRILRRYKEEFLLTPSMNMEQTVCRNVGT